jgi:glycine/D-amino acid oxidase-like deaminating enzyme
MISKADAIVIGSGRLGAATAYYLSQRKKLSIALIDKHDIGSQTSPRAAGMVSCARKSDLLITRLSRTSQPPQSVLEAEPRRSSDEDR